MNGSQGFTRTASLGRQLSVEITVSAEGKVVCEWTPDVPRKLSGKQMQRYQQARDAAIAEMAAATGRRVLLLEA
jgi:hypothetical protein